MTSRYVRSTKVRTLPLLLIISYCCCCWITTVSGAVDEPVPVGAPWAAHEDYAAQPLPSAPVPGLPDGYWKAPLGGITGNWPAAPPPPAVPPPPIPPPPPAPGMEAYRGGSTFQNPIAGAGGGVPSPFAKAALMTHRVDLSPERFKSLNASIAAGNDTAIEDLGNMIRGLTENMATSGDGDKNQTNSQDWPTRLRGAAMRFVEATQGSKQREGAKATLTEGQKAKADGERQLQFTYFDPKNPPPWMMPPWRRPEGTDGALNRELQATTNRLAAAPFSLRQPVF